MRVRLLPLVLSVAAALAVAAPANASLITGIAENQPQMFDSPLFAPLGVTHARLVVSYNVVAKHDDELARAATYLAKAQQHGVEVLVQFEHARGDAATLCKKKSNFSKPVCKAPSAASYQANLKAFLNAFPQVKLIGPWNEINHYSQGTSRNPKLAATYAKIAHKVCVGCTVVDGDLLDQADNVKAKHPTFKATAKYIKAYRKAYGKRLNICGLHNYSDTNRFRTDGTKALIKLLGCKQYWLTETGGLYKFGSFWSKKTYNGCTSAAACQLKATKYLFTQAARNKKIKRVYVYTWYGGVTPRFDAGLVAKGKARPAYAEVAKHVQ
jgi:hypothetical protein